MDGIKIDKDLWASFTTRQIGTVMEILVNLQWGFLRDALADWADNDYRNREITPEILNLIEKFGRDLQELESVIKGIEAK